MTNSAPPEYEFRPAEAATVGRLSAQCRLWSAIGFAAAVGYLALFARGELPQHLLALLALGGLAHIGLGITFAAAGSRFARVVDTNGRDVSHSMAAMRQLGRSLTLQVVVTVIGALVLALSTALGMFGVTR